MFKERTLVGGEVLDDGSRVSPGCGEELLVTLEKAFQVQEIAVISFVEFGRCGWIEIRSCLLGCTELSELLPVSRVERWVGSAGVVEVVEASTEEHTSGFPERVGS